MFRLPAPIFPDADNARLLCCLRDRRLSPCERPCIAPRKFCRCRSAAARERIFHFRNRGREPCPISLGCSVLPQSHFGKNPSSPAVSKREPCPLSPEV